MILLKSIEFIYLKADERESVRVWLKYVGEDIDQLEFVTPTSACSTIRERWLQNRGYQANGAGFEVKRTIFATFGFYKREKELGKSGFIYEQIKYKFGFVEFHFRFGGGGGGVKY